MAEFWDLLLFWIDETRQNLADVFFHNKIDEESEIKLVSFNNKTG
jgi:hypothetical protein